jgi:hypothetical protein
MNPMIPDRNTLQLSPGKPLAAGGVPRCGTAAAEHTGHDPCRWTSRGDYGAMHASAEQTTDTIKIILKFTKQFTWRGRP